jgi:hypothetical protein
MFQSNANIIEVMKGTQLKRYKIIKSFLFQEDFNGFTKKDLFIMQFIKKGWGQDIAALSNMAEALTNIAVSELQPISEIQELLESVVYRAVHNKVNPYKRDINKVKSLGRYGYYLEHLNIILGCYHRAVGPKYYELNKRISEHLLDMSMKYDNYHADLLPNSRMKWAADQAAIIYSLWLYDKNNNTNLHNELSKKWLSYMENKATHKATGLFITEVQGVKKFSKQPRGCALSYLIHYMSRFAPGVAKQQWELYKEHMLTKRLGMTGFREFLPSYKGRWTPDSGPIIAGVGIAASGLGMNAATSVGDDRTFDIINNTASPITRTMSAMKWVPGVKMLAMIATDKLASAIYLNAETKTEWYFS